MTRQSKLADNQAMAVFVLTAATARVLGWDFELRTELPLQRARNLRWLWNHLQITHAEGAALDDLVGSGQWPQAWREVSRRLDGGPRSNELIRRGIETRRLFVDLDLPIERSTLIHSGPVDEEKPWLARI